MAQTTIWSQNYVVFSVGTKSFQDGLTHWVCKWYWWIGVCELWVREKPQEQDLSEESALLFTGCFTEAHLCLIGYLCINQRKIWITCAHTVLDPVWENVPSSAFSCPSTSMAVWLTRTRRSKYGDLTVYCKQSAIVQSVRLTEWCCFKCWKCVCVCVRGWVDG